MKALAGDWVGESMEETSGKASSLTYRVSGGGSTVVETLLPGMPHEMVTMYYLDGDDLVLTHYCGLGNQPHMKAGKLDGNVLKFDFAGGSNVKPDKDMHMHSMTLTFVDADHIKCEWTLWSGGKADHTKSFNWTRKKS